MFIGLNDLAQFVLVAPVAAVRIWVQPLHQLLVARLDRLGVGGGVEAERVERLERGDAINGLRGPGGIGGAALGARPDGAQRIGGGRILAASETVGEPGPPRVVGIVTVKRIV